MVVYKSLDVLIHWIYKFPIFLQVYMCFCLFMIHWSAYAKSISATMGEGGK